MRCTTWQLFPNPEEGGILYAPIGPGVYELRSRKEGKLMLIGRSEHVVYRMTSLLPPPHGAGHQCNTAKQDYILENLEQFRLPNQILQRQAGG